MQGILDHIFGNFAIDNLSESKTFPMFTWVHILFIVYMTISFFNSHKFDIQANRS